MIFIHNKRFTLDWNNFAQSPSPMNQFLDCTITIMRKQSISHFHAFRQNLNSIRKYEPCAFDMAPRRTIEQAMSSLEPIGLLCQPQSINNTIDVRLSSVDPIVVIANIKGNFSKFLWSFSQLLVCCRLHCCNFCIGSNRLKPFRLNDFPRRAFQRARCSSLSKFLYDFWPFLFQRRSIRRCGEVNCDTIDPHFPFTCLLL